ncbi:3-dehydroquinate synthase [Desulfitobacterium dichloroeliminans LMG P-21439]|uniref:3-dehydroquinate synthase n=1 Tax=Desulfitobacterium dichloroeliminans (strain LMG P-21439 / DCA1) TaxID=871963 RepID=L0FA19_DESDL|nr:3-dehydroquinate synthase [Desulfitobacterium dichloroeliminans]AGA69880.1 3-dehydroquinate synthase [Desulfitobacterium dichloroeliminans LMG P-21439]
MQGQRIDVASEKPYPVFLGVTLENLGEYLATRIGMGEHLLVVTHPNIAELYLDSLKKGLPSFRVDTLIVPQGEEEKSLERISELTSAAIAYGADRKTVVLALGGGVIGDLAGFFASMFMRGMRYVQIPTTLLAMVDSSIGGKVAVNHPAGKNLLGDFYPPLAVWTDFSTLETLPWEEMLNGLAETVKHAVIADEELLSFVERHAQDIKARKPELYKELASRSSAVKVKLVSEDETEQGKRMFLNFGHSFGHALEAEMAYQGITHGQGVSIGMVAATHLAQERGLMSNAEVQRLINLLKSFGLPVSIKGKNPQTLIDLMGADKKNYQGQKVLVLPKGIGQAIVVRDAKDEEIMRAWKKVIK